MTWSDIFNYGFAALFIGIQGFLLLRALRTAELGFIGSDRALSRRKHPVLFRLAILATFLLLSLLLQACVANASRDVQALMEEQASYNARQ